MEIKPLPSGDGPAAAGLEISLFCVLLAAGLAFFYPLSRAGFEDLAALPAFYSFCLSLFITLLPDWAARKAGSGAWYFSHGALSLGALALAVLAGLVQPLLPFNPVLLISAAGLALACDHARAWRLKKLHPSLPFILLSGAAVLWVIARVWSNVKLQPLSGLSTLTPENILGGRTMHTDNLMHSAITAMLETYGALSTGLDGLVRVSYHGGSHWIFGQLSRLTGSVPLDFYQLGYPVVFFPFLFKNLLSFSAEAAGQPRRTGPLYWALLLVFLTGFLKLEWLQKLHVLWGAMFISPSYAVSTALVFALFSAGLAFARDEDSGRSGPRRYAFLLLFFPAVSLLAGFTKVSALYLIFAAAGYSFLRLPRFRAPASLAALALCCGAGLLAYKFAFNADMGAPVRLFSFYTSNFIDGASGWALALGLPGHLFAYYFWTLLYLLLARPRNSEPATGPFPVLFGAELLAVLAAAGAVPGMVISIHGGSGVFFSDFQSWLALALVLGIVSTREFRLPSRPPVKAAALALLAAGLATAAVNYLRAGVELARENQAARFHLLERFAPGGAGAPAGRNRRLVREPAAALAGKPETTATETLRSLRSLPLAERKDSFLFIPRSNRAFWDLLPNCERVPFLAPALSGLALIDGLPDARCEGVDPGYGYAYYDRSQARRLLLDAPFDAAYRKELCARVAAAGKRQLIILPDPRSGPAVEKVDCSSRPD